MTYSVVDGEEKSLHLLHEDEPFTLDVATPVTLAITKVQLLTPRRGQPVGRKPNPAGSPVTQQST